MFRSVFVAEGDSIVLIARQNDAADWASENRGRIRDALIAHLFPVAGNGGKRLLGQFALRFTQAAVDLLAGVFQQLDGALFALADPVDQFLRRTLVALVQSVGDAGYLDPAGNPVPETELTGSGPAQLFHDGRVVQARWTKDGVDSAISLTHRGKALTVPAGHTWVELVPKDNGDVEVTP